MTPEEALALAFPEEECVHDVGQTKRGPSLYAVGTNGELLDWGNIVIPYGSAQAAAFYVAQAR